MFKLFTFTVRVKNLALNKRTRGPDLPLYCLNCTKLHKLILRKITKTVATRCHILKLKCTKLDFGWAPSQSPLRERCKIPHTAWLELSGPTAKRREGKKGGMERQRRGRREGRDLQ